MEKYCLSKRSTNSTNYKLSGICVHSGGLNGGHYYAVSYNFLDKKWYEYNDSSVGYVSDDKLFNLWEKDCEIMSNRIKKMRKEI